jgi:CheY-like chemotaxis protein
MATVLIVEDDVEMRESLEAILRQRGYTVCMALAPPYAQGALALLTSEKVDAVILDLILGPGGMDGFELARRMRDHPIWCTIPIFISSGLDERDIQRQAMRYAFYGLRTMNVGKPPNTYVLFSALEDIAKSEDTDHSELNKEEATK